MDDLRSVIAEMRTVASQGTLSFKLAGWADRLEAATALQSSGGEVVCYGLRRKGSTAIVGIIPNKVAQKPATLEWFNENYDEVPLCLASRQPETTAVTLCRKHGMYAKKGCADCDADIDMLTRIEPPDIASPAQPSGNVYALLRSIRYNADNGSQDRPVHERLRLISADANRALAEMEAELTAAPAPIEQEG